MSPTPLPAQLERLASLSGVVTSYVGTDGAVHRASVDTVRAVLNSLGTPVPAERDVDRALREFEEAEARRVIDPVITTRPGAWPTIPVRLPNGISPDQVTLTLQLESGESRRRPLGDIFTGRSGSDDRGEVALQRAGWTKAEPGYHSLVIESPQLSARARFIVAPPCPIPARSWGAFMPLHAARGARDRGIGTYSDLAELAGWVAGLGGGFVGTLPLYPIAERPPVDPSPYLPLSRLAYGELYIDLTVVPELVDAPDARQLLQSRAVARPIDTRRDPNLVDYDGMVRVKRQVLEALWHALVDGGPARRDALASFGQEHPELVAYAEYRSRSESEGSADFHLYVQWLAFEQLTAASQAGCPLYADLPVGVRSDGFDAEWTPDTFAPGVQGGAPPDSFFSGGQNWGFQPLQPEQMRRDGYRYMIECLRRACRHAAYLRIDHVPGLHRLFWIPDGMEATDGAYVTYRSDELRAIVCLEAHRAGTVIVGEDLGTVPEAVRTDMAADRMLRSWVMQFESTKEDPLPDPPPDALATWGTHDLPRFATYLAGQDLGPDADAAERLARDEWRHALQTALEVGPDPAATFRGCLEHLATGPARLIMVDLEELWGERTAQNRPGTGPEEMNWTRRARLTLGEMQADAARIDVLSSLDRLRRRDEIDVTMPAAAS
jgi:4-alpha-glucanotransferase